MSYENINNLFQSNTALKLLKSDNAALIIGFFIKAFKEENRFYIKENEIFSSLEDYLYLVNQPEKIYEQSAKKYQTDWTQDGSGFLRKYYESGDEPFYELTPASETALKWIDELNTQRFIGTESRLKLLVDMLRKLSSKSKKDIYTRIKELEVEKERIEKEIEDAKQGRMEVLDERQIEEQFFNAEETAKRLLSDFRQVEQNFRDIDKDFRKKIITTTKAKGKVLDELFAQQDYLCQTDQGKSFKAFWEFIVWEERNFERIGKNSIPDRIEIETLQDYLKLLTKEKEYNYFIQQYQLIVASIPQLKNWIAENPLKVIEHKHWQDTLKVCHYFLQNPQPELYIRQLPVEVPTKFVKEHEALFRSLLDYLIPEFINNEESSFEKRYHLRYAEPLIRIRFLDKRLSCIESISDISIPLSEFENCKCNCTKILVKENLMNFLTLPSIHDTIALWSGGGFNVSYLKEVSWLQSKQFYYWGDIDTHGFQILHQFRSYFPNTIALMMDKVTLEHFKSYITNGKPINATNLTNLSKEEAELFHYLKVENIRLEQEKIAQGYTVERILEIVNSI